MRNHDTTMPQDNRPPEEIERDIQRTRDEVSSTIDAIQRKLTPGQMMDQAISYARTSLPADFGSNLNNSVRENPIPVSLIGIGIAWLMMSGQGGRQPVVHHYSGSRSTALNQRTGGPYDATFNTESSAYATGDAQDEGMLHKTASKVADSGREMKSRLSEGGHNIRDRAHDMRNKASDLGHRSQDQYYRAKDSFGHLLDEQPLVIGALGIAIGAALGAAMPRTQREDQLMGGARDQMMDKAKESASEQAERLKEAAQKTKDEMQASGDSERKPAAAETDSSIAYSPDDTQHSLAGNRSSEQEIRTNLH